MVGFLKPEELKATAEAMKEDRFSAVGRIDLPDIGEYKLRAFAKAFSFFPIRFTPGMIDWLYYYPYDREDFGMRLQEEKQKDIDPSKVQNRGRLPWTYQDGRIFKARLIRQTEKALLLRMYIGTTWVPRAQVDFEPNEVWLPLWLIEDKGCLLYTSPSPRDRTRSRMPSSA